jgi:hypothetical protein
LRPAKDTQISDNNQKSKIKKKIRSDNPRFFYWLLDFGWKRRGLLLVACWDWDSPVEYSFMRLEGTLTRRKPEAHENEKEARSEAPHSPASGYPWLLLIAYSA